MEQKIIYFIILLKKASEIGSSDAFYPLNGNFFSLAGRRDVQFFPIFVYRSSRN